MYIEQHFDQFYLASTHHTEAITLSQAEHLLTHQINPINKIEKKITWVVFLVLHT